MQRWRRNTGEDEEQRNQNRGRSIEYGQSDKGNQRTNEARYNRDDEPVAALAVDKGELLMPERRNAALEFLDEIGLAVLSGGEFQAAEKLRRLVHQRGAGAAELCSELVRTAQHPEARKRPCSDQSDGDAGQCRRKTQGNDDLHRGENQCGEELHHEICRAADALDVTAQELRDAGVL